MKNCKSSLIFEKTLENSHPSQPFTVRMVKHQFPDSESYILERLDRHDAMGNPVWLPVDITELSLAIDTMGEFFQDLTDSNFKQLKDTVEENLRLKDIVEIVLAFHHKKGTSINFDVTGQGERFIKIISRELFNDNYPEDELLNKLVKKHSKFI